MTDPAGGSATGPAPAAEGDALFAYGTLRLPQVAMALLGLPVAGDEQTVSGYRAAPLAERIYPGAVIDPGAGLTGRIYTDLGAGHFRLLDAFEGCIYRRVPVAGAEVAATSSAPAPSQGSGGKATTWIYALAPEHLHLAGPGSWDTAAFESTYAEAYMDACRAFQNEFAHLLLDAP